MRKVSVSIRAATLLLISVTVPAAPKTSTRLTSAVRKVSVSIRAATLLLISVTVPAAPKTSTRLTERGAEGFGLDARSDAVAHKRHGSSSSKNIDEIAERGAEGFGLDARSDAQSQLISVTVSIQQLQKHRRDC